MTEFYTHCGDERYFEYDEKVCDEETGMALDAMSIVRLLNENEQLKQTISNYKENIDKVFNNIVFADKNAIQSLKKQLKEELKE